MNLKIIASSGVDRSAKTICRAIGSAHIVRMDGSPSGIRNDLQVSAVGSANIVKMDLSPSGIKHDLQLSAVGSAHLPL